MSGEMARLAPVDVRSCDVQLQDKTMRAVVQRVSNASVTVEGKIVGTIGQGLLALLGVAQGDDEKHAEYLAGKTADLRIFEDDQGKMNLSVKDVKGQILVASQFTLLADCRQGRRPSFTGAADPATAERLYGIYVQELRNTGLDVQTGVFRAMMDVTSTNQGPVTILLDSSKIF
jgi:D-tyrosyl-tRNA(Tyr) deacylase